MLIDAFLFNDEVELLKFRIAFLQDYVDKFVIAESAVTFSGKSKELIASNLIQSGNFESAIDLEVLRIEIPEALISLGDRWAINEYARDCLIGQLKQTYPESTIILSDVDEIPSHSQVKKCRLLTKESPVMSLRTPLYLRKANWQALGRGIGLSDWKQAKVMLAKHAFHGVRWSACPVLASDDDGAHLSYLGMDGDKIKDKYSNISHPEYDDAKYSQSMLLSYCDRFLISHFHGAENPGFGLLRPKTNAELSDLQKSAYAYRPIWFGSDQVIDNFFVRVAASIAVGKYLRGDIQLETLYKSHPLRIAQTDLIRIFLIHSLRHFNFIAKEIGKFFQSWLRRRLS